MIYGAAITVPTIVPLRLMGNNLEDNRSKFEINTSTPIELKCESSACDIFYTTNGAWPELGQSVIGSDKAIEKYVKPFYLPVGNYLVKAVAVTPHGQRSLTNTKLFRVSQGPVKWSRSNEDDAIKFLKDNQQAKRTDYRRNFIAGKSLQDVDIQSFSVGCGDFGGSNIYNFNTQIDSNGDKPHKKSFQGIYCTLCNQDNPLKSVFCLSCGCVLAGNSSYEQQDDAREWQPFSIPLSKITLRSSVATQTVGLFYPTEGQKATEQRRERPISKGQTSGNRSTSASSKSKDKMKEHVAKGSWETNLEFMTAAMRDFVQGSAETRVTLSQMKLKQFQSLKVSKGSDNAELVVKFELKTSDKKKDKRLDKDKEKRKVTDKIQRKASPSSSESSSRSTSSSSSDKSKSSQSSWDDKSSKLRKQRKDKSSTKGSAKSERSRVSSAQSLSPTSKLLIAAVANHETADLIKQYVDEGANVNTVDPQSGHSLLGVAVQNDNAEVIPLLSNLGADVDQLSKGETPLHLAVKKEDPSADVVRALLECQANPLKKNSRGENVVDLAENTADKMIQKLLKAACDKPVSGTTSTASRRRKSVKPTNLGIDDGF